MQIDFQDETESVPTDYIETLQQLLLFTAKKELVTDRAEVSVSFVRNQAIQALNRDYRQIDMPTDVISFALQESAPEEVLVVDENIPFALGDIIISIDKAEEQAEIYNHSIIRELGFLTVHGFLHLLGYNHLDKVTEEKMFQRQTDILGEFGLER